MSEFVIFKKQDLQELIESSIKKALNDFHHGEKPVQQEILDVHEAAEFLKLRVATIYSYTSQCQIPFIKRGKKLYFEKSKLEEWLIEGKRESIGDIKKRFH